jgi:hypothetical protein
MIQALTCGISAISFGKPSPDELVTDNVVSRPGRPTTESRTVTLPISTEQLRVEENFQTDQPHRY